MSTKGRWLLIFGIIALVGAILFGVTVAAFGVQDGNYGISIGGTDLGIFKGGLFNVGSFIPGNAGIHFRNGYTNYDFEFEQSKEYTMDFQADDLKNIEIGLMACHADIVCSDTDKVSLSYTTGSSRVSFSAELEGEDLVIKEKNGSWFNIGSTLHSTLKLSLPEKQYKKVKLDLASGKIVSNNLVSAELGADLASGSMELGAFADAIDIDVASGKMILQNCSSETVQSVNIDTASGSVEMTGYRATNTKIDLASGSVQLNDISGNVNASLASGKVVLGYAEWNGDLSVDLASGKADITLPAGSGANVNFERLSGSMNLDLDGQSSKLSGNSTVTVGGANVHDIRGHVLSGSIYVHN